METRNIVQENEMKQESGPQEIKFTPTFIHTINLELIAQAGPHATSQMLCALASNLKTELETKWKGKNIPKDEYFKLKAYAKLEEYYSFEATLEQLRKEIGAVGIVEDKGAAANDTVNTPEPKNYLVH